MILSLLDWFYHSILLLLRTAIFRLLIVTSKVERSVADLMVANFLVQKRVSFICWQWNLPRPHQSRAIWLSDSYLHQSCAERETKLQKHLRLSSTTSLPFYTAFESIIDSYTSNTASNDLSFSLFYSEDDK